MDLAQNLVRMVTRAFYETRHIIIVDAVITHSALRDNDLAYIMSMNIKDLHKLVGKLLEERLIHKFGRPELREGQTRPVTQTYYYIDYHIGISRPTAVKGLANTGPKSLEVSISASDGPTDAEIAAEKTRKEKIAQQNALPSWMSNSTVTGDSFSANANDDSSLPVIKPEEDDKAALAAQADANKDHAAIDDYFLRLKEEQERLKLQDEEEGSDEDEDDFEDVVAAVTIDAPSIAVPDLDDGRLAKKVKLEEPVSDESEDDDMEFEDV
ncbi:Transcription initiation factor IIE subunit alpha [Ceratocystis platani]|uniref:Transcription initiation factor IIE subunit alpha n=1 Tax=Ceratocystis fimbriata f. sp. platani TaxID=88771 RepID=A0A0F8B642_CERFI|nr:Transcription initiation factor IIE subunit alpha [Ceratocystis platani]